MPGRKLTPAEGQLREIACQGLDALEDAVSRDPLAVAARLSSLTGHRATQLRAQGRHDPETLLLALRRELAETLDDLCQPNEEWDAEVPLARRRELIDGLFMRSPGWQRMSLTARRVELDPEGREDRLRRRDEPALYALIVRRLDERANPEEADIGLASSLTTADSSRFTATDWSRIKTDLYGELYVHAWDMASALTKLCPSAHELNRQWWYKAYACLMSSYGSLRLQKKYRSEEGIDIWKVGFADQRHADAGTAFTLAQVVYPFDPMEESMLRHAASGTDELFPFVEYLEARDLGRQALEKWCTWLRTCNCDLSGDSCGPHQAAHWYGVLKRILDRDTKPEELDSFADALWSGWRSKSPPAPH